MTPLEGLARQRLLMTAFQMPSVQTMVSRKSSITNAFVSAIIPVVQPDPDEVEKALSILEMQPTDVRCAYCGDKSSEWDHLRALVLKQRPTGYISEIANLVPACGKCNQSKGNAAWNIWILSKTAPQSPTSRKIRETPKRVRRLELYEQAFIPRKIDFAEILGLETWEKYWESWMAVNEELRKCQEVANTLRKAVTERIGLK